MISMFLTRMVSAFGPGAVATQRVGGQIESISWNTADGFAAALNSFTAQNYGAGKNDRIRQGYKVSLRIMVTWGLIVTAAFVLFPGQISSLFFHEPEVLEIAVGYMIIIGIGEAFMCVEMLTIGALSGLGQTKICSIISILLTGARIPLALGAYKNCTWSDRYLVGINLKFHGKRNCFLFCFSSNQPKTGSVTYHPKRISSGR